MSDTPMTDLLRERWERIKTERAKALGPNPIVVKSFSVPAAHFLALLDYMPPGSPK